MGFLKRYVFSFFLIVAILVSFSAGTWFGKNQVVQKICPPENVDFSLLWEAWDKLQKNFVSPDKMDTQQMIYGAIAGMVKSVGDPYTVFFNPDDTKKFLEDVSGRFEGIGIEIDIRKDQLQVVSPLEGTPAQQAGLKAGDKILKINDTFTPDLSIDEAVSLIRGPQGTDVTLTIFRDEWQTPKEIKITRALIEVPSLKYNLISSETGQKSDNGDIAYIRLYQFSEKAGSDFSQTAVRILNSPAKKIILDLRGNPGGYLEIAQQIAGWFLPKGKVVVTEEFGRGMENEDYKTEGNSKLLDYPMVILLDNGSASAAEILASALRDNRGIKIIGVTSFGKGSVQQLVNLANGSTIKITIAKWLTPNGDLIQGIGIAPDVKVEITEEDAKAEKDPQMERAIEIIKNMI